MSVEEDTKLARYFLVSAIDEDLCARTHIKALLETNSNAALNIEELNKVIDSLERMKGSLK